MRVKKKKRPRQDTFNPKHRVLYTRLRLQLVVGDDNRLFASVVFTLSVFRHPDLPQPCGAIYLR